MQTAAQIGCIPGYFLMSSMNRPLSKPGKDIRFLEFVSLPPPRPSPTGEGAVLRQIQNFCCRMHMDGYETIAIFAANASPPPVGEGQGGGSRQQLGRFGILSGCRARYGLEGSLMADLRLQLGEDCHLREDCFAPARKRATPTPPSPDFEQVLNGGPRLTLQADCDNHRVRPGAPFAILASGDNFRGLSLKLCYIRHTALRGTSSHLHRRPP